MSVSIFVCNPHHDTFLAYLIKMLKTQNTAFQSYILLVYTERRVVYEQKEKDNFNGCVYCVIGPRYNWCCDLVSDVDVT